MPTRRSTTTPAASGLPLSYDATYDASYDPVDGSFLSPTPCALCEREGTLRYSDSPLTCADEIACAEASL